MWKTKQGSTIAVKDMELSHVKNALNMLIKNYSMIFIQHGARYCYCINDKSEEELRTMLTQACNDSKKFKLFIAEQCYGPVDYKIFKELLEI